MSFYLLLASGSSLLLKGFLLGYMTVVFEVNNETNRLKHSITSLYASNLFQFPVFLTATIIFLPSFLLAIISTLDLTNKKSLSILISHPYLVLLPTITFFSYNKNKNCGDGRISFSPKLSWVNMLLTAVVTICSHLTHCFCPVWFFRPYQTTTRFFYKKL